MAPRLSLRRIPAAAVGLILLAGSALGCRPALAPNAGAPWTPPASLGASVEPSPSTVEPSPSTAGRDAPPDAALAAEGGDPVTGQLGTFVWQETGSDSPWLPGTPVAVGAGEPLAVALIPDVGVDSWSARFVPAEATGPEGSITLGQGSGSPAFPAPGKGAWTVEVVLVFAAGAGQASYFWRLEVE